MNIIWKKSYINTNSSEYFRIPGFSIIVSSEEKNRCSMQPEKKGRKCPKQLVSGVSSGPGPTKHNLRIIKEE